jgi:hypothetical protein
MPYRVVYASDLCESLDVEVATRHDGLILTTFVPNEALEKVLNRVEMDGYLLVQMQGDVKDPVLYLHRPDSESSPLKW